jgi:hypothetical protein
MTIGATARVAFGGGFAGATNAWLCYARLPVAVEDDPTFHWHVIPAGAVHGAVLAAVAFGVGNVLSRQGLRGRLAAALPLAWLAGFAAWIPLNRSAFDQAWSTSLTWPFHGGWVAIVVSPFQYFGFVVLMYYALVALWLNREGRLTPHVAFAALAGVLGSLWWWIAIGPWYFSVLHGVIWGTFVGIAAWVSQRNGRVVQSVA